MTNSAKKLLYAVLANDFNMFIEKCYSEIDGSQEYIETLATKLIVDKLNCVTNGKTNRLLINVPPRTLKTTIVSIAYTAWLLGHNPKLKILCISYGEVAIDFSIMTRQIMQSDWYQKVFSKTKLQKGYIQNDFFKTTENGYRRATSMNGELTGRGADLIIIDDPQKAQDVLSDKIRNKSNKIFSNTIITRLNNKEKGQIIVVAQRLHVDDFSNYVQKIGKWDVLSIPAIAEKDEVYTLSNGKILTRKEGEVINPKIEPIEKLEEIRSNNEYDFSAQYQQAPVPVKGCILNFEEFQFFNELPSCNHLEVVQSWDIAVKTGENNDYSVCITAAFCSNILYIFDIFRQKFDFTDLVTQIHIMKKIHKASNVIIESNSIGTPVIKQLEKEGLFSIPYNSKVNKVIRAATTTQYIRTGQVKLVNNATWLNSFKNEVSVFPHGKHDDQVDALTQLINVVFEENQITGFYNSSATAAQYGISNEIWHQIVEEFGGEEYITPDFLSYALSKNPLMFQDSTVENIFNLYNDK